MASVRRVAWSSDLGCHIDGFIAVGAHTFMMQDGKVSGRAADALVAANTARERCFLLLCPSALSSARPPAFGMRFFMVR